MRLRKDQIEKLSKVILDHLQEKGLIQLKGSQEKALERIQREITRDIEAEVKLEEEVYQLMDQFRPQIQSGQLNERELFLKINKEMAKKKKVVL